MRSQFLRFFSERDWRANEALQAEIAQLRDDIAPAWLQEPLSLEATAERYVRAPLRQVRWLKADAAAAYVRLGGGLSLLCLALC
jgi:hypothetical protein